MITFCKHQNDETVKKQNKYLLQNGVYEELYKEIDDILPSLEYCLAPRKKNEKKGVSSLRSGPEDHVGLVKCNDSLMIRAKNGMNGCGQQNRL